MELDKAVKLHREYLDLSQTDYGKKYGVTRGTIALLESGRVVFGNKTTKMLKDIIDFLIKERTK